ncbi:unnamed protein product [Rhizoctonia solani]|uniref:DUF6535 domain-containing protein n=1 Tax=Rhizoctonia solani TaxID=456999 RepID=A0A8H3ADS2_9AGAM|nr:unnamed protein product [Rhizoctonia solani]
MPRSRRNVDGKLSAELEDTIFGTSEQFDQYGAELGKESLFWKVYVQETDKHDKEIVEKWHRQVARDSKAGRSPGQVSLSHPTCLTKVIMRFYSDSLFSAVSAAFLVESSKRLREDPAEVSAQILRSMPETLWAVANNSPPPAIALPRSKDTFSPSAAAVAVNTIWFSSLGLSVGTSFIAMLAKDWCHSFWADRHGPPCLQGRQRQRKWTMIERWRMRELIETLPLLIHLSLFMFSVGLCIYVWDLYYPSSIPLILITLTAVLFYILSSNC